MKFREISGLVLLLAAAGAWAQDGGPTAQYAIGLRAEYHDNITQASSASGEISDWLNAPFFEFSISQVGKFDAQVDGFLEYVSYNRDSFQNESRGRVAADFNWRLAEDKFHWVLEDNLARAPVDPLALDTPNNEQQTNFLATGPDVILRFGAADRLTLGARYNDFYAEKTSEDFTGWRGEATWSRQVSATRSYGVNLSTSQVEYDERGLTTIGYDRNELALQFENETGFSGGRNILSANVGYSEINFDDSMREKSDAPLLSLRWERINDTGDTLNINLVHGVDSIAGDVAAGGRDGATLRTAVSSDPFTRTRISADWSKRWDRVSFTVRGFFDDQDYDVENLDQEYSGVSASITYEFRPLVSLLASGGLNTTEYLDIQQEDDRLNASLGLRYQRTRNWFYDVTLSWYDRSSSVTELTTEDLAVTARVTYRR